MFRISNQAPRCRWLVWISLLPCFLTQNLVFEADLLLTLRPRPAEIDDPAPAGVPIFQVVVGTIGPLVHAAFRGNHRALPGEKLRPGGNECQSGVRFLYPKFVFFQNLAPFGYKSLSSTFLARASRLLPLSSPSCAFLFHARRRSIQYGSVASGPCLGLAVLLRAARERCFRRALVRVALSSCGGRSAKGLCDWSVILVLLWLALPVPVIRLFYRICIQMSIPFSGPFFGFFRPRESRRETEILFDSQI